MAQVEEYRLKVKAVNALPDEDAGVVETTSILTDVGPKQVLSLVTGDQVLSFNEDSKYLFWDTVKSVKPLGKQEVSVVAVGERRVSVTSNQKFYSYRYDQPYDFSEMEIGSLRAAAESTKHFADHKRPARKNPRARWPVFGRTGFKMTQGSSHSLSHWNRKGGYDPERPRKSGRYSLDYTSPSELTETLVPVAVLPYGAPRKMVPPLINFPFLGGNQYQKGFSSVRNRAPRLVLPEYSTPDIMWLLGLYTGDGSSVTKLGSNGQKRFAVTTFSVPANDRAHAKLIKVMKVMLPDIGPSTRKDGIASNWASIELVSWMEELGFQTGAYVKRIPKWVVTLPEEQRMAFIAGYLDSDGCASKNRRNFSIKSVNRQLLADTAEVLTSLGISSRLYTEFDEERPSIMMGRKVVRRGSHNLSFTPDRRLLKYTSERFKQAAIDQGVSAPIFRKMGRSNLSMPNQLEIRKVKVEKSDGTAPVWSLELMNGTNFVANGLLVKSAVS